MGISTFNFHLSIVTDLHTWDKNPIDEEEPDRKELSETLPGNHDYVRASSQIPVLGLTGRVRGGRAMEPGMGFSGQNLRIKFIPCVGTHF